MAQKKKGLGRGLSALLSTPQESGPQSDQTAHSTHRVGGVAELPISAIETNPYQPRTKFDQEQLEELSASIKELGIIQPITVRKSSDSKFQLISGERRFRASQLAGLEKIPVYIREANDQEMLEMALVENIQRQELDPIEVALSYDRLIQECKLTQDAMSQRVGKKRSTISNYLRLLKLQPLIQAGVRDRMISMGHARALINISDEDSQLDIYQDIIARKLSVREVEALVKEFQNKPYKAKSKVKKLAVLPESLRDLNESLSHYFGSKTQLSRNNKGQGKISISFKSDEDLERIVKLLQSE
jgi:ParB family chromosome partitioning protein